ncbi:MAG: response regulator, partial [Pseudomonadota bacterium]
MQIETAQATETVVPKDLEALRALVVDDEFTVCETLTLFLQHLGVGHINTASNGAEALDEINRDTFDYVFVDLMMPEVTGMDVLKRINQVHQPTSVIIMTGYPSMEIVIEAMHNGASDFLAKPFRFEDVKLSLERLQRLHGLMEKNWLLHQELEEKKEVEELNNKLEKKIRIQTIMYNIVDSLSKTNRSESLYHSIVKKAIDSVNARKACFMIYDQGNSHLLVLSQMGFKELLPGTHAPYTKNPQGNKILDARFLKTYLGKNEGKETRLELPESGNGLISIPFNIRGESFGVLLVEGKEEKKSFDKEDEFILKFLAEKAALNIENIALYGNLKQSLLASLMSLVSALEAKDAYTQQHSSRVTEYAIKIAEHMGSNADDLQRLESNSPLHDIGKIGISDNILNKPGRLTDQEFDHIRSHPMIGVNIVSPLGL